MTLVWVLALGGVLGVALVVLFTLWHDRAVRRRVGGSRPRAPAGPRCWRRSSSSTCPCLTSSTPTSGRSSSRWDLRHARRQPQHHQRHRGAVLDGPRGVHGGGRLHGAYPDDEARGERRGLTRWLPWNGPWSAFAGSRALAAPPAGLSAGIVFLIALLAGGSRRRSRAISSASRPLRLRGDYLAIVTLGFGEIIRNLIANVDVIGASRGPSRRCRTTATCSGSTRSAALVIFVSYRLLASAPGRAMLAVREDEVAAARWDQHDAHQDPGLRDRHLLRRHRGRALGPPVRVPAPDYFKFDKSFEVIIMVVLGGWGRSREPAVAAVVLAIAPEALGTRRTSSATSPSPRSCTRRLRSSSSRWSSSRSSRRDVVRLVTRGAVRFGSGLRVRAGGGRRAHEYRAAPQPPAPGAGRWSCRGSSPDARGRCAMRAWAASWGSGSRSSIGALRRWRAQPADRILGADAPGDGGRRLSRRPDGAPGHAQRTARVPGAGAVRASRATGRPPPADPRRLGYRRSRGRALAPVAFLTAHALEAGRPTSSCA
jgi:hypothetical protein